MLADESRCDRCEEDNAQLIDVDHADAALKGSEGNDG